jgi:propanol-preferring alcohol dehydrogenase
VSSASFEQAYRSLRRGGTLEYFAQPSDNQMSMTIFENVLHANTDIGSIFVPRGHLREVFELHAAGRTEVIREVRPLAEVNESIAHVEAGRVAARIVFRP